MPSTSYPWPHTVGDAMIWIAGTAFGWFAALASVQA